MTYWTIEKRDNIAIASYDNPPMNYLVGEAIEELVGHIATTFREPDVRVVILTGGPDDLFVTHFSVEALSDASDAEDLLAMADYRMCDGFHAMAQGLNSLPVPVIAAMTGSTMGGGFELSLACDIRIAQRGDYAFGLPEARVGILPGGGGTQRLSRLLGAGQAINMLLRGMVFSPDDALAKGLVHEVADDAKAHAIEIAKDLATLSPVSMREIKRCVYEGSVAPLNVGLHIEGSAFLATMQSKEARDAMKAFTETSTEERKSQLAGE